MADVYLVTGATGSIGSAIARYLYRQGEAVRVFVRSEWKLRNFFPEETSAELERKIEIIVGDISQKEQIEPAMQDVSAIFHCTNFPLTIFERNITATQNVLELPGQSATGIRLYKLARHRYHQNSRMLCPRRSKYGYLRCKLRMPLRYRKTGRLLPSFHRFPLYPLI